MLYRMLIHSWDIFRRLILESEKLMVIENLNLFIKL